MFSSGMWFREGAIEQTSLVHQYLTCFSWYDHPIYYHGILLDQWTPLDPTGEDCRLEALCYIGFLLSGSALGDKTAKLCCGVQQDLVLSLKQFNVYMIPLAKSAASLGWRILHTASPGCMRILWKSLSNVLKLCSQLWPCMVKVSSN